MAEDLNLEKRLSGLSPEARSRIEATLKEALAKEAAAAAFDRSGFDRGPYDRGGDELQSIAEIREFPEKAASLKKELGP